MAQQDRINGLIGTLGIKAPVRVATTANITLSGEQTIDGVAVVAGDRVLVKDQTTGSENGIYAVATTAWAREPDFDGSRDVVTGTMVRVVAGTVNAGTMWELTTTGAITIGTTSLTFAKSFGATAVDTHAATSKTTPVDTDELPIADSAASFGLKKLTWANLKSVLQTTLQFLQSGVGAVSRTSQSKLREVISVKDFGAVGDGVTDDTAAIQAAINAVSNAADITLIFPAGHFRLNQLYLYTAGAAGYAGNGNITLRGAGHTSVVLARANSFTKGTVLEFINATGNSLNVSGAVQAQNIQIEDMLVTGNTTGYIVYGEYTPEFKMRNTYVTNQNATGGGVHIAQCWFSEITDGSWIEFTGAGTSSGKGFVLGTSAISGGLVGLSGKSAVWNWGTNFSVEAVGFSVVSIDDSECGGAAVANVSISQPIGSLYINKGYFEGNAPSIIASQIIKNVQVDGIYLLAGDSASGDANARMQFSSVQTGEIKNIYCFRPWSNLIEIAGDTGARSNVSIGHISYIHDNTSALTKNVEGCADNGAGLIRVTITGHGYVTGRRVNIASVTGTTEANGEWGITVIDADTFDLVGSTFANPYVSGGTSTLLCYVFKSTNTSIVPSVDDITFSGGNADLDATGALRIADTSTNPTFGYSSRNGEMPAGFAMDIVDAAASGTGIALSGTAFKHYRYTTSAATVITVQVPAITVGALDGSLLMISNLAASTERLQIRKTDGGTVTYGYLAPGETCLMQYERTGRTLIMRKLQPEGAPSTVYGTAAPVAGTWRVGDRVYNSAPAVGQPKSWVCTVAGTPGTWVSEGNL